MHWRAFSPSPIPKSVSQNSFFGVYFGFFFLGTPLLPKPNPKQVVQNVYMFIRPGVGERWWSNKFLKNCIAILRTSSTDDCEHKHLRNSRRSRCICFRVSCGLTRTLTQIYFLLLRSTPWRGLLPSVVRIDSHIHFYALYPTESKTLFTATGNAKKIGSFLQRQPW